MRVDDGIAHIDVARSHIDFQTQGFAAIGELAVFHACEQVEVFFDTAVAVRAVFACFGQRTAVFTHFFGSQIIDIRFAVFDQADCVIIKLIEIVGSETRLTRPMETEPLNVFFDGVDVFIVFFFRVGIVKTQVAQAVINIRQTEVQADGFGVADVQVTVWLRRKTGLDGCMFTAFEVFFDNGADKMVVRELVFIEHGRELSENIMSYRFYLKTGLLYSKYKLQRSSENYFGDLCMDNYESVGRLEWLEVLSSIRLGAIDESIKLTSRLINITIPNIIKSTMG